MAQRQIVSATVATTPEKAITTEKTAVITTAAKVTSMIIKERAVDDTRIYASPRLWIWANLTVVVVDCRRRPRPLMLTMSHGHAFTAAMFSGLFENLPTYRRRSPARPSTPMDMWEVDIMNSRSTPPRKQLSAVKQRVSVGQGDRQPGGMVQRGMLNRGNFVQVWRETSL